MNFSATSAGARVAQLIRLGGLGICGVVLSTDTGVTTADVASGACADEGLAERAPSEIEAEQPFKQTNDTTTNARVPIVHRRPSERCGFPKF